MNRNFLKITFVALNFLFVGQPFAQTTVKVPVKDEAPLPPKEEASKAEVPKAVTPRIRFTTQKPWQAARWYAVGKWVQGNGIRWLGGDAASRIDLSPDCIASSAPFAGTLERAEQKDESLKTAEILKSDDWVAIEISPNVQQEEFIVKGPDFASKPNCQTRLAVSYAWKKDSGKVAPLLMLAPQGSRFYGYQVDMRPPEVDTGEVADITLDLLLGGAYGKLPYAVDPAKTHLIFMPIATVRGEWLPTHQHWGLSLGLEQTVTSFGGVIGQKALFSDWQVGGYWEHFFPIANALQWRGGLKYRQHLGDDKELLPSFSVQNKDAKYILASTTLNLFFASAWMTGLDLEYGPATGLAGRGVKQSFLNTAARIGYRTASFMFIFLEGAYRSYGISGGAAENMYLGQMGIRLDL